MGWRATGLAAAVLAATTLGVALDSAVSVSSVAAGDAETDVDALIAKLVGGDAKAGAAAADALVAMGASAVSKLAAAATSAASVATRVVALSTLGRIAADHDGAVAPLTATLADADPNVREAAALGLLAAGPRAKAAGPALNRMLADPFLPARLAAAAAMIRSDFSGTSGFARTALDSGMTDRDPIVRATAIGLVARTGMTPDAAMVTSLVNALGDLSDSCRTAAIRALGAMRAKENRVIDALRRDLTRHPSDRSELVAAVRKLTDKPPWETLQVGGWLRGDRVARREAARKSDKQTEAAVTAALDWLARHQSPDGSWSCDAFDARCKLNRCDGKGLAEFTPGVTGLALLAFLGAGETHAAGPHAAVVARGLQYVRAIQDDEGCIGPRLSGHFIYNHGVATVALLEAFMLTGDPTLEPAASRAVKFVESTKNPGLGWRYNCPPDGDNDTSVTGWMTYAAALGDAVAIGTGANSVKDGCTWIEKMTDPDSGRVGYWQRGGPSFRTTEMLAAFPPDNTEALTAIGVMVRFFAGRTPMEDPLIAKSAEFVQRTRPRWSTELGTIDFYYWFWGSTAMHRTGGEPSKKWNDELKTLVVGHQRFAPGRCEQGSWDTVDPWTYAGGRVYATAMCCMALEAEWRMDSILDAK